MKLLRSDFSVYTDNSIPLQTPSQNKTGGQQRDPFVGSAVENILVHLDCLLRVSPLTLTLN